MSGIGALITVGTVATLVGVPLITSVIAQNAAKDADKGFRGENDKGINVVDNATAAAETGLGPYAQAGANAVDQQQALSGALGPEAQQAAYDQIKNSPAFQAQQQAQQNAILSNASATGGLRGGNVQAALAGNASDLLGQAIAQQYGQYQGLSQAGQQAAAQQGVFGVQGAGSIADRYAQNGQSRSAGTLGVANAQVQGFNASASNSLGLLKAASGVV
jgi:hypothetical protein